MMKKYYWSILAIVLFLLGALYMKSDVSPSTANFTGLAAFIDTPVNRTIAVVSGVVFFLYVVCTYIGRE
ncbi:MAG: hypothetical protein HXS47_03250 [Theionarchaea archaeon]|nr:hypothetical protein [Theionarchaea archaeon]